MRVIYRNEHKQKPNYRINKQFKFTFNFKQLISSVLTPDYKDREASDNLGTDQDEGNTAACSK